MKKRCDSIRWFLTGLLLSGCVCGSAHALEPLTDKAIDDAVRYGLENQDYGLSTFLGSNWREGGNGALLNIYTPFIEIARSAATRGFPTVPTSRDVAKARKASIEDIHYIFHHPTVKCLISMYGDTPDFARGYFARIEGVGKGRKFTLRPTKSIPQRVADRDEIASFKQYAAINTYHFKFDEVRKLDEFQLVLYGKNKEPIRFKIRTDDIL